MEPEQKRHRPSDEVQRLREEWKRLGAQIDAEVSQANLQNLVERLVQPKDRGRVPSVVSLFEACYHRYPENFQYVKEMVTALEQICRNDLAQLIRRTYIPIISALNKDGGYPCVFSLLPFYSS